MTKSKVVRERRNSMELHRKYDLLAPEIAACVKAHDVPTAAIRFGMNGVPMGLDTVRNVIKRYYKKLEKEGIPHEINKGSLVSKRHLFNSDQSYSEYLFRGILSHIKKKEDENKRLADMLSAMEVESSKKDEIILELKAEIAELRANPRIEVEAAIMNELLEKIGEK